jgi:hypothetical protein
MPRRRNAKLIEKEIALHLPRLKRMSSAAIRANYLADMMAAEGLEFPVALLAAYNVEHDDGLLVFTLLLKREQEFEGNIGDLLESLANYLPR